MPSVSDGIKRILRGHKSPLFVEKNMITKAEIIHLAEEALAGTDRFIVEVLVKMDNVIMVFIDGDSSVTIDHCVELSRYIEHQLDRETEDFELRVSSAGLDHPFKMLRQYIKNIGRQVQVTLLDGEKQTGKLLKADEKGITIDLVVVKKLNKIKKEVSGGTLDIAFEQIEEVKPVISFH